MNIKTDTDDKQQMIRRLSEVKRIITKLLKQMETGLNWNLAHSKLMVAMTELRFVNRQLAVHHLVVCIANRLRRQQHSGTSQHTISEFIKTLNYTR